MHAFSKRPSARHLIFKYRASKTQEIFFIFSRVAYKFLNFCRALLTVNISEMSDKAMKSLEEVIKYKLNFLPKGIDPFFIIPTFPKNRRFRAIRKSYVIYETKNTIFSNDSFSVMEDITPLFIYISSCEKYYKEKGIVKINKIFISSIMENDYGRAFSCSPLGDIEQELVGRVDGEHRTSPMKSYNNAVCSGWGYCYRYIKPFKILFDGRFDPFLTEEETLQYEREAQEEIDDFWAQNNEPDSDDNNDEENLQNEREIQEEVETNHSDSDDSDEELSINDFKTFKLEQCVICLEKEPKVLFCNCGHICICEKCLVRRYDNCPVCKKENTILRIIE